jgi:hypothetical protein
MPAVWWRGPEIPPRYSSWTRGLKRWPRPILYPLAILTALSTSSDYGAKDAAAIYVKHLFPARQKQATDLLLGLFCDPDPDIRAQVLDTIDEVTTVPAELARIAAASE